MLLMLRRLGVAGSGALVMSTVGCGASMAGVDRQLNQGMSRSALNNAKRECMYGTSCTKLGLMALHVGVEYKRATWRERADAALAKEALVRGCADGEGQSCAVLVEYGLLDSSDERDAATRRAYFFGAKVRSHEEVAAAEEHDAAAAAQKDAEHEADIAQQQAELDASQPSFWDSAVNAAAQTYSAYKTENAQTNAIVKDAKTATNRNANVADRVGASVDAANRVSIVATGEPLVDLSSLPAVCLPCATQLSSVRSACDGRGDACKAAFKSLTACMESHPCGK